jgi:hypothetical protein
MKQHGLIMTLKSAAVAFWAVLIPSVALDRAASQENDVNAYIARAPIAGVPNAPYGQWNEEQKKGAFKRVVSFCEFLCIDSRAASYLDKAAADRATAEAKTCLGACIVNHLPQDFPQLAALKTQLRSDYEKAKQLGSSIAWPLQGK